MPVYGLTGDSPVNPETLLTYAQNVHSLMQTKPISEIAKKGIVVPDGIDKQANEKSEHCISTNDSKVSVQIIPTNEDLMIARHTFSLLANRIRGA